MVNLTILRSLLVTSCLLALSQASKSTPSKPDEEIMIKPKALIISGGWPGSPGNSVEVYIPSTGQHCQLPDLPGDPRWHHTMEEMTVCGGFLDSTSTSPSCLTLIDGTWQNTSTLLVWRGYHPSWASPSGVILFGGRGSPRTSERIQEDGTSVSGFPLEHSLLDACAINLGSTVILTGGHYSRNKVSEYSESGFTRYLPELQQGRQDHGCSYFENEEGTKTFLVTGGWSGDGYIKRSSTELLVENSAKWIYSGELPTPREGLRGANIDQRVIMTGGRDGNWDYNYYDEILEFKPSTGAWSLVDRMKSARSFHAVSVISSEEIDKIC